MSLRPALPITLLGILLTCSHSNIQAQQRIFYRPCSPTTTPGVNLVAQRGALPAFPPVDIPKIPQADSSGIPVPLPPVSRPPMSQPKSDPFEFNLPSPKVPGVSDNVPPPPKPMPIPPVKPSPITPANEFAIPPLPTVEPAPINPSPINPSPIKPATMKVPYKKPYRNKKPLRDTEVHNPSEAVPGKYSVAPNHYPDTPVPIPSPIQQGVQIPSPNPSRDSTSPYNPDPPKTKKVLIQPNTNVEPVQTPPWEGIPKRPTSAPATVVVPQPVDTSPNVPRIAAQPSTIQPITGNQQVLPEGSSPWVVRVEVINAMTHLIARGQNTEFRVVCQNLKMQSPSGDILAEGEINIIAAGFQVSCNRLIINWQDEWVTMEGNVRLHSEKESQRIEMEGTHLRIRLTTLSSAKAGNDLRSHILKTSFFRPVNQAEQSRTPRLLYQSPLRDWK